MRLAKLIGLIYERYGTVLAFAEKFDISYTYLSQVLNGKHDVKKSTIERLAEVLEIPSRDIGDYFFPESCADEQ